ncbi:mannose-6-phosphate isomerase, class I [Planomonospora sp. ID91781]|uniref:mannose-6-phosphate isomerase, class I n=1 Tax=Planomonospora sp. ID91781 TaxID=2738135 RepID=UPI0018C43B63|nr:mannose-6-phosphate isomerase, class I [Planomonospora sp. ID91781]MBG0822724.1 mannose-6-phosphate isomerase, class I [Planomonospora sp. ID91781]
MHLMTNPVKDYPWGSRTDIAALTGRPVPAPGPEAEMWLGAHPAGPSLLSGDGRSLAEAIAADPLGQLGEETLTRFGARLPYLMKLIAVARPLSLQVHPSAGQAADGHARGVYGDPWAKPELVCALTPFTALAGFRPPEQAAMLVDRLAVPALAETAELLRRGAVLDALRVLLEGDGATERIVWAASSVHHPDYALVVRLARQHPGDPACLAPLLLRRHELAPGQALFLGAGVLHCYLRGFGVEIMGGSDNVMRAGLTAKPLDVPELLRVTDPAAVPLPVPERDGLYAAPSPEFRLRRLTGAGEHRLAGGTPRILLCTEGAADAGPLRLTAGESAFVPAAGGAVTVTTSGTVFCAEPGTAGPP